MHCTPCALLFVLERGPSAKAANIPMMATTTKSSISVNAEFALGRSSFISSHLSRNAVPPGVVQFGERGGEFAARGLQRQLVAADFADLHCRNAHELGAFDDFHGVERFAGDDDARLRFAEEQRIQTKRPLTPSLSPAGGG